MNISLRRQIKFYSVMFFPFYIPLSKSMSYKFKAKKKKKIKFYHLNFKQDQRYKFRDKHNLICLPQAQVTLLTTYIGMINGTLN